MSPARASRIHMIRTRIAAAATALFVALFGVIGIRLASGHDPALATSSSTSGTTSTTPATTTTATDEDDVTTSDQSSQAVSPVTTSQS